MDPIGPFLKKNWLWLVDVCVASSSLASVPDGSALGSAL